MIGYPEQHLHIRGQVKAPDFMIIGAQKSGTTALYEYLSAHPYIAPSELKELHFFNLEHNYAKGDEYYQSLFPERGGGKLTFDASPSYLRSSSAPKRICEHNPTIKLIIILREPVSRAYSAWNMYRTRYSSNRDWFIEQHWGAKGVETLRRSDEGIFDFYRYVQDEIELERQTKTARFEAPVVFQGNYAEQIKNYLQFFSWKNILILESEDLYVNTENCLGRVEDFLALPRISWGEKSLVPVFTGNYAEKIDENSRELLRNYYASKNEELFRMLGQRFNW